LHMPALETFFLLRRYIHGKWSPSEAPAMFTVLIAFGLMVWLTLAGVDLLVSGVSPDELSRMGLQQ